MSTAAPLEWLPALRQAARDSFTGPDDGRMRFWPSVGYRISVAWARGISTLADADIEAAWPSADKAEIARDRVALAETLPAAVLDAFHAEPERSFTPLLATWYRIAAQLDRQGEPPV
ncbi:hypothetical protein F4X33_10520 [Candidatus Poribacteria bacterium]|nr:hypothetical protein [Candidatus Poribacteria bacterium]